MEGILNRAEAKIKKALEKTKDNALHKEVDTAFNIARSEGKKVKVPHSQKEQIPHIALTSFNPQSVSTIFGIKEGGGDGPWTISKDESRKVPDHLESILADYAVATGGSPENEALMRCRIDAILVTCLAAQKKASARDFSVHLQCETDMLLPWTYRAERKIVSSSTDYSLWYKAPQEMECNLLVVEAKKKGVSGDYQALAYMAMLHHALKDVQQKDTSIYGIATDSFTWTFLYLDNDGKWTRRTYHWDSGQEDLIVSMIHKTIRRAAPLSKELLETPPTSSGVKRTLSGDFVLRHYLRDGGQARGRSEKSQ